MGHTIGYVLTIFGVCIVLLVLDPVLALVVLVPLPFIAFGFWRYSSRYAERTRQLQEELAAATTLVEETVAGMRVVKGLGAGPALSARFRRQSDEVVKRALDVANVDAVFLPLLEAAAVAGNPRRALVRLDAGDRRPDLGRDARRVHELRDDARLADARDRPARRDAAAGGRRGAAGRRGAPRAAGGRRAADARRGEAARARALRRRALRLRAGRPVLDWTDARDRAGTSLALVGETGSGKSTVAALLARFYDADAGSVSIDGVDVRDLRSPTCGAPWRSVFSETFLFTDTVRANIAYARPDATATRSSGRRGSRARTSSSSGCPSGYDTLLGERGYRCRAASGSGSRSPVRSSPTRRC